jgi:release factor glutamine methyltransferase
MNISQAIAKAASVLTNASIAEPRREASSLLAHVIQKDAAFLIAHSDDSLAAPYKMMFDACVRRRAEHEPFQYITGRQEFYGLSFAVTRDVLIPRPETEILVEKAIDILKSVETARFCEVGVGSGCISIAILRNVAAASGVGVDISEKALTVAQKNADANGVGSRLDLLIGDVFDHLNGTFDMIVSNPPYVTTEQLAHLQPEVRDFEPQVALCGGDSGLDIIKRIVRDSPRHLKTGGHLLLEVGFDQSAVVDDLFDESLWRSSEAINDLQQIPRIVVARLR